MSFIGRCVDVSGLNSSVGVSGSSKSVVNASEGEGLGDGEKGRGMDVDEGVKDERDLLGVIAGCERGKEVCGVEKRVGRNEGGWRRLVVSNTD